MSSPLERSAEVIGIEGGLAVVRLLEPTCRGCAGCGGRCALPVRRDGSVRLPVSSGLTIGERGRLRVEADALQRLAWRGYGSALLMGVLGTGLGAWMGHALDVPNVGALLGLLLGTLLAARWTKRHALPLAWQRD